MSCTICVEEFNKSSRKEVACDFCDFSVCRKCTCTYILGSTDLPHCMNCKKEWTRRVLVNKLPKAFIDKELKAHKEKIYFEREKALLSATQPLVERELQKEKIKEQIEEHKQAINKMKSDIIQLTRKLHRLERNRAEAEGGEVGGGEDDDAVVEKKQFVRACPSNSCRGFLSTQWKCGLCNLYTCSDCHEIKGVQKDSEHTCIPENIETAKLLAKDTKTCPKCACLIHKINGCDQMWCVQCHTTFNWKTGRIETGVVHNPEYFKWMRDNKVLERNPLDVQCGRELDYNFITNLTPLLPRRSKVLNIIQHVIHIQQVIMPQYANNALTTNQHLRISYLRNKITEEDFKRLLQRVSKAMEKNKEILGVYGMFVTCATDIMYRLYDSLLKNNTTFDVTSELQELTNVSNDFLKDISKCYGSTQRTIGI